jgi:hypothetical protein
MSSACVHVPVLALCLYMCGHVCVQALYEHVFAHVCKGRKGALVVTECGFVW